MEELLQAAVAYYNNGSNNLRELASNFFKSMDTNRDRRVSRSEFVRFLQQSGYNINPYIFNALDRNGDGYLDYWEVLTLYYIIKTRLYHCADCGVRLLGLYFTCVECFDRAGDTYDLCSICYSARQFRHRHTLFLDNHMLLIAKRRQARGSHNLNQAIAPAPSPASTSMALVPAQQTAQAPVSTRRKLMRRAFRTLETAVGIGNLVAACTIM